MRMTFASNIREITRAIETAVDNVKEAKIEGLKQISNSAFNQAGSKYLVKGNHAHKSESGKRLVYDTPPGANINSEKVIAVNKKTNFRVKKYTPMFVKGKFVSRSGKYEKTLDSLARHNFQEGSNFVDGVKVTIEQNSLRVFADTNSEVFILETRKQQGKSVIAPITKSFRSVVNLWKKVRIKLGK